MGKETVTLLTCRNCVVSCTTFKWKCASEFEAAITASYKNHTGLFKTRDKAHDESQLWAHCPVFLLLLYENGHG